MKQALSKLHEKLGGLLFKSSLSTTVAIGLAAAPIALIGGAYYLGTNSHPSSYTVMVTNFEETTGGSGVVISTSRSESLILTNEHVCSGVLNKGGKVKLVDGSQYIVTGIWPSNYHDLCVVKVANDLKTSVNIASNSPDLYGEATVTGHPALLPNLITKGHFGGKQFVTIMTGAKKCTEADYQNPEHRPYCVFFGMRPILKTYEAQVITATIMPGSSGSAVLNESGELSGLVFAGNGRGLSYGYVVPYEFIVNFLEQEVYGLENVATYAPWSTDEVSDEMSVDEELSYSAAKEKFKNQCESKMTRNKMIREFCDKVKHDIRI